jgi:HSP20 family protein
MIFKPVFNYPMWRFRSPFNELENMRQQMDRLMGALAPAPFREGTRSAGVFPLVNLSEDRDAYFIRAELPGVQADALEIQAERSTISLSGERKIQTRGDKVRYHRREREAGTFSRVIGLPGEIDPDKVKASLENGILTVTVPKAERVKPRQIEIK